MKEIEVMAALYSLLREQHGVTWMNYDVWYEPHAVIWRVTGQGGPDQLILSGYGSTLSEALRQALCVDPVTGKHRSLGVDVDALIARLEGNERKKDAKS